MNARDKALRSARKGAYDEQKKLRVDVREIVDGVLSKADVRQAVRAAILKRGAVLSFAVWLGKAKVPADVAKLVAWLCKNKDVAFAGYNPYLEKLTLTLTQALVDKGIVKRVDTIATSLHQELLKWLEAFHKKTGGK